MKQLKDQFSRENKMFEDHSSKWQFYDEMRFLNLEETLRPPFTALQPQSVGATIAESPSPEQEGDLQLDNGRDASRDRGSSLDVEVKVEEIEPFGDLSLFSGKPGTVVSSSDMVLSEPTVDELLRLTTYPATKKRRHTDVVNGESHEQPCPEAPNGGQKKTEKASTDAAKRGRCGCHFEDDCFKESLLEMVKAQKEYFKIAAEAQKEQLRLFSALGDVLNQVSAKLLAPTPGQR
ncbi:hypothetical protein TELCIR_07160 [Teladorsagia circumcincta]|uniref:MADF domain-containing protein n=1 Tax=Teladorsagia circumcincta TaxID=45464 RepID=A0A2G9UL13_TELCI|nr:hypothetical protein TELCIR_07160 [Teladorsagia circumcincta]